MENTKAPIDWSRTRGGNNSLANLDDPEALNEAIKSPPPSNTRRWKHKKYFQTIAGNSRYFLSPGETLTPDAMEASMRREILANSLKNMLDEVPKPSLG